MVYTRKTVELLGGHLRCFLGHYIWICHYELAIEGVIPDYQVDLFSFRFGKEINTSIAIKYLWLNSYIRFSCLPGPYEITRGKKSIYFHEL